MVGKRGSAGPLRRGAGTEHGLLRPVSDRQCRSVRSASLDQSQADSLSAQWEAVTDVPQIPGNYYITRNVSFAFRAVVYKNENERESLYKYNKEINKEIDRKRKEFNLNG